MPRISRGFVLEHNASAAIFALPNKGGLAQLARAFAWHAKGHRFDSGNLHFNRRSFSEGGFLF